jgi:hypothetical protein
VHQFEHQVEQVALRDAGVDDGRRGGWRAVDHRRELLRRQQPERDQVFAQPSALDKLALDPSLDIGDGDETAADQYFAQTHDPPPRCGAPGIPSIAAADEPVSF